MNLNTTTKTQATIVLKKDGSTFIEVWFGDILSIKTAEEAEKIANKIIEILKYK